MVFLKEPLVVDELSVADIFSINIREKENTLYKEIIILYFIKENINVVILRCLL